MGSSDTTTFVISSELLLLAYSSLTRFTALFHYSSSPQLEKELAPIDPNVLHNLERQAQKVAASLVYIMDNLRNSLHAVSSPNLVLHSTTLFLLHPLPPFHHYLLLYPCHHCLFSFVFFYLSFNF